MGFYSNNTPEEKRITELTGDVNLTEEFKEELEFRQIPLYKGHNIQKRLRLEVEQGKLKGKEVDERLKELLDENTKIELPKEDDLLQKIIKQNEIIIQQNKILIEELKKSR